jgi:hypothetical protein
MGVTVGVHIEVQEWLSLLAPGGESPRFLRLERRWERVDGGALVAMVAHTGDPDLPIVRWDNPFRPARQGHGQQPGECRAEWRRTHLRPLPGPP